LRSRSVLCVIALLALPTVSSSAIGRSPEGAPRIEVERIGSTLAIIRIAGISTAVLLGSEGVLVVDPGLEEAAPFLEREIRKLGWGGVRTVIDTHWHFDHAGGNKAFGPGAEILASQATREWLSQDERLLGMDLPAYPDEARPRAVKAPAESIPEFAEKVTLKIAPGGHTGGDLLVHFEGSKLLAIGDIVFAGQFPFVDIDHGGSVVVLAEVLQGLIDGFPQDTRFIPGHGPVLARNDLVAYRQMILETTEIVRDEMSRGRSLEEMRRSAILAKWKRWDGSFKQDDWIGFIHASLERTSPAPGPPE
jgi:glyoxylase-like metal-dependent hydrolase (beta-lactamase superfamily II)